jgi:hypothetical protein
MKNKLFNEVQANNSKFSQIKQALTPPDRLQTLHEAFNTSFRHGEPLEIDVNSTSHEMLAPASCGTTDLTISILL